MAVIDGSEAGNPVRSGRDDKSVWVSTGDLAALMESFGNNHGLIDGSKRIAFAAAD